MGGVIDFVINQKKALGKLIEANKEPFGEFDLGFWQNYVETDLSNLVDVKEGILKISGIPSSMVTYPPTEKYRFDAMVGWLIDANVFCGITGPAVRVMQTACYIKETIEQLPSEKVTVGGIYYPEPKRLLVQYLYIPNIPFELIS